MKKLLNFLLSFYILNMAEGDGGGAGGAEGAGAEEKHIKDLTLPDAEKMILQLRAENASRRLKEKETSERLKLLSELEEKARKSEEERMANDGKLKELLDLKEKEINDLKPLKDYHAKSETYFGGKLEAAMKSLTEAEREVIGQIPGSSVDRLAAAEKLISARGGASNDDLGGRPGQSTLTGSQFAEYLDPKNWRALSALSVSNPTLYRKVQDYKKQHA
jgi:hypothetical protein